MDFDAAQHLAIMKTIIKLASSGGLNVIQNRPQGGSIFVDSVMVFVWKS